MTRSRSCRSFVRRIASALLAGVVIAAAPAAAPEETVRQAAARTAPIELGLRDLAGVDELKTWFNAGKGHTRLILLLSPT